MINWRDCIVPIRRDPPKQEKPPAKPYTNYEASTALALEARRRKQSYGQLTSATDWQEQDEIITAYMAQKQSMTSKKRQQCTGCIYRKPLCNDPAVTHCTFSQTHRLRRKDAGGMCLEYTKKK